jgi:Uma2 family endonuclease
MTLATPSNVRRQRTTSPLVNALSFARVFPITVEQYHRMIESGTVPEDSTVELLRGALVRKDRSVIGEDPMGHSPLHRLAVVLLTALAARLKSEKYHLQIQLPVSCLPDSEPEPDGAIVRGAMDDYSDRLPGGADVSCVIEDAHTSLDRDREDKLPIYAGASVPQYIIVNLQNGTIEVYTDPDPAGEQYRTRETIDRAGTVALRLPDGNTLQVTAAELLPKSTAPKDPSSSQ